MSNVLDIRRHPSRVLKRVRNYASDLNKVGFQTERINEVVQAGLVFMADIWECLENGEIMEDHLHFEADGTYAKLVCHTGDATIFLDIKLMTLEDCLVVLYAAKEDN